MLKLTVLPPLEAREIAEIRWLHLASVCFQRDYINGTNICCITNIPPLSPKNKDCIEINDQIMNTLVQDNARTYCSVDCVDYEDKLGEKLHPTVFFLCFAYRASQYIYLSN